MNAKHTYINRHEVSAGENESVLEIRREKKGDGKREQKGEERRWQGECIQRKYLSMQRNGKFEVASIERRGSTRANIYTYIHTDTHTQIHRNTHAGIDKYVW